MEILTAPVVPGTKFREWDVVHGGTVPWPGRRVAFTTRRDQNLGLESVFPRKDVLVLDEAWPLKFSDECPPMKSARDGRRVLKLLLRGKPNQAQEYIMRGSSVCQAHGVLCHPQDRWLNYVAADGHRWEPHGVLRRGGVLTTTFDDGGAWHVAMSRRGKLVGFLRHGIFLKGPRRFQGEVMFVYADSPRSTWSPACVSRAVPPYLAMDM